MMKPRTSVIGLWLVAGAVIGLAGCDVETGSQTTHEEARAVSPLAGAKAERRRFVAEAKSVQQVPGYTYVQVISPSGSAIWVATLSRPIKAGDVVNVTLIASRRDFRSSHLDRVFPLLHFGVVSQAATR